MASIIEQLNNDRIAKQKAAEYDALLSSRGLAGMQNNEYIDSNVRNRLERNQNYISGLRGETPSEESPLAQELLRLYRGR